MYNGKSLAGVDPELLRLVLSVAHEDFTAFKQVVWRRYQNARHLQFLDHYLMQVLRYVETNGEEGIGRLLLEMPPRHGKTQNVSRAFPAYFLGRNPDKRVILTSYDKSLPEGNSRWVRTLVQMPNYQAIFPFVELSTDSKAKDRWDLMSPYIGGLTAVGKGGAVTGKGGDLIIIDDPVRNRKEADSALQRNNDWDWLTNDLWSRKEPGAAIISIMTRWHSDDIHGRLRQYQDGEWTIIRLPALAEKDDPMGRLEGEALWPERFTEADLRQIWADILDYPFYALYQQSPQPREGGLFKQNKFKIIENAPDNIVALYMFWDLALSEKASADFTVGTLIGLTSDGEIIVLAVHRIQKDWSEIPDFIEETILKYGTKPIYGIEQVFFHGQAVRTLLKRPKLLKYRIKGIRVDTDKYSRAAPAADRVNAGLVYVLNRAWTQDWLTELTAFPFGANDDQVDSFSGAFNMLDAVKNLKAGFTPMKGKEDYDELRRKLKASFR